MHRPGTGINYAVVEVKTCQAMAPGIIKDVETLTRFVNDFGYERGIYLLYGGQVEAVLQSAANIAAEIRTANESRSGFIQPLELLQSACGDRA